MIGPEAVDAIVALCQQNAAEIGEAIGRTFDLPADVQVGAAAPWVAPAESDGFDEPGLAFAIMCGDYAFLAVLPEAAWLPAAWSNIAAETRESRLATLAQELSICLVPENLSVVDYKSVRVPNLRTSIVAASPASEAWRLPLALSSTNNQQAVLTLFWPLLSPEKLFPGPTAAPAAAPAFTPAQPMRSSRPVIPVTASTPDGFPAYTQSLLRIKLPVNVTLAAKKQPINKIIELGIGSIIHFDKPCDEPLDLEVNGRKIAHGEAVKVGDKFGIRVRAVSLPEERFQPLGTR